MFYENWMSYIKDDAKITKVAMPGSHNSGTMGMIRFAECQSGSFYEQYKCGVRFFDIRLKTDKNGRLIVAHGLANGMDAESAFRNLRAIFTESDEFFVISLRKYMNQGVGPITLRYKSNSDETSRLINEYLLPEKYAFSDFENIADVTMGDIRKSGKKYIIINENREYDYSCDCPFYGPWEPSVYGLRTDKFAKKILDYFNNDYENGFFWFQIQQTPNFGTDNGMTKFPDDLDRMVRPFVPQIISDIAKNPDMLRKVNIIAGDFMSADTFKASKILALNLLKGIVKNELVSEYLNAIR